MKASIYNTLTIEVFKPVPTLQVLKLVTILVCHLSGWFIYKVT